MIPQRRDQFNQRFTPQKYATLLALLQQRSGTEIHFRVAETPIFMRASQLQHMALAGAQLTAEIMANPSCIAAATGAIPAGYLVAGESAHPNFVTADFALVRSEAGELTPKLVEIQAFPSLYGYQPLLCASYRDAFELDEALPIFLGGMREKEYWDLLATTVLAGHHPENVVLAELDPQNQKTRPDFEVTSARLGIPVVDIREIEPIGNKLHYRDSHERLVPIHRIYNRAIADELIARNVKLPFQLSAEWDVEWAGHPNWYFQISKFSIPWLSRSPSSQALVPPAVFLSDFLEGRGREQLASAGVTIPDKSGADVVYRELLLKPLFSFAGKGIQFEPTHAMLQSIPASQRQDFLLQQRMSFVPTIETPRGLTQAEIRILYLWPDHGALTPALSLVRLGRGKMMGVDHNKNQQWVGASAAFIIADEESKE